jgi:hypothetical protein
VLCWLQQLGLRGILLTDLPMGSTLFVWLSIQAIVGESVFRAVVVWGGGSESSGAVMSADVSSVVCTYHPVYHWKARAARVRLSFCAPFRSRLHIKRKTITEDFTSHPFPTPDRTNVDLVSTHDKDQEPR